MGLVGGVRWEAMKSGYSHCLAMVGLDCRSEGRKAWREGCANGQHKQSDAITLYSKKSHLVEVVLPASRELSVLGRGLGIQWFGRFGKEGKKTKTQIPRQQDLYSSFRVIFSVKEKKICGSQ